MDHFTHFLLRVGDDIAVLVSTIVELVAESFRELLQVAAIMIYGSLLIWVALRAAEMYR